MLIIVQSCHTKSGDACGKNCNDGASTKTALMDSTRKALPLSCKLTNAELRKRKEEVMAKLKQQVTATHELADGYSYSFMYRDDMLDDLISFVKAERQCCDFFTFNIQIANDSTLTLEITGPDGAKEFLKNELEM